MLSSSAFNWSRSIDYRRKEEERKEEKKNQRNQNEMITKHN